MKSWRGKGPVSSRTHVKRIPVYTPSKPQRQKQKEKDPVEVYCRLRPLQEDELESCANVHSDAVLQITPPPCSLAYKSGHRNPTQHTFKHVFNEASTQDQVFDRIAFPLVADLMQGKNGLLFAYGITNSGKTYTMNGEPEEAGVLPRSLDVIFNSIADVQAPRFVFQPDGNNGFNTFTEEDAAIERQRMRPKKLSPRMRSEMPEYGDLLRVPEPRKVEGCVDEDSLYSVFVSYVEIYNNYVYDLLEEQQGNPIKQKALTSHLLREDSNHNMFVLGATEVEVKSTEEAFEVLYQGQKQRRVAQTQLNQESSRSHSVFTIRLVQAPLDHCGKEVLQDKSKMFISQLSLVDLAGSERTSRTRSAGDRLREAGNINKALMTLRTCMETLRDNQLNNANKIVPYRDSKLTHLFKNFFDGEGKVRMVVCVSPKSEDYDESIHVMKFAELTQEVVVDRPESIKVNHMHGLAPGRKRAYMLYKAALKDTCSTNSSLESGDDTDLDRQSSAIAPHPYFMALGVLSIQKYLTADCNSSSLTEFKAMLEDRHTVRGQLTEDLKKKQLTFRSQLLAQEQELLELRNSNKELKHQLKSKEKIHKEVADLKSIISSQDDKIAQLRAELEKTKALRQSSERVVLQLRDQLKKTSNEKDILLRTTEIYEADKRELENELNAERQALQKNEKDIQNLRQTMNGFVSHEKEKFERMAREMQSKERDLVYMDTKLRKVEELIKNSPVVHSKRVALQENTTQNGSSMEEKGGNIPPLKGKNNRKRSQSENWLEHRPTSTVNSGDLLQPVYKKKKTVTTPQPKDLQKQQMNKYCLQHQEEDSEGDVKTSLYKGEIFRTRGGGTAVQFTDVEVLKHSKPKTPRLLPRRSTRLATKDPRRTISANRSDSSISDSSYESSMENDQWSDVETRCTVGIEHRPGSGQPAFTHTQVLQD